MWVEGKERKKGGGGLEEKRTVSNLERLTLQQMVLALTDFVFFSCQKEGEMGGREGGGGESGGWGRSRERRVSVSGVFR